jgi:hypothetical protein
MRVHAIVEERVQQQLDNILAAEMEKVRVQVEERVQERVRTVVQHEVRATACEAQARLAALAHENECLREAFVEHSELCIRNLGWSSLTPSLTSILAYLWRVMWSCRRRMTRFATSVFGSPVDRRRERLRARLEALRRHAGGDDLQALAELRVLLGPELEEAWRVLKGSAAAVAAEAEAQQAALTSGQASSSSTSAGNAEASSSGSTVGIDAEGSVSATAADGVTSAEGTNVSSSSTSVPNGGIGKSIDGQYCEEMDDDDDDDDDDDGPPRLAEPPELSSEDEYEDEHLGTQQESQRPETQEVASAVCDEAESDDDGAEHRSSAAAETSVAAEISASAAAELLSPTAESREEVSASDVPAEIVTEDASSPAEAPEAVAPEEASAAGEECRESAQEQNGLETSREAEDTTAQSGERSGSAGRQDLIDDQDLELQRVLLLSLTTSGEEASGDPVATASSSSAVHGFVASSASAGSSDCIVGSREEVDAAELYLDAQSDDEGVFEDAKESAPEQVPPSM